MKKTAYAKCDTENDIVAKIIKRFRSFLILHLQCQISIFLAYGKAFPWSI